MCTSDGAGMRAAYPITVRDRREALRGSAGQAARCPGLRLAQLRYPVKKLQPSMFKDYHKF